MRNFNGLAWRNLMQRKLRTMLSVVGVALGVALVFAAASVGLAAGKGTTESADHVDFQVTSSSGTFIDQGLVEKARAAKGIQAAAPALTLSAIGTNDISITLSLNGIEPAADAQVHTRKIAQGSFLTADGQLVVLASWAAQHKLNVGDKLPLLVVADPKGLPSPLTVQIVGTTQDSGQAGLLVEGLTTLSTLQQATNLTGKVAMIEVRDTADADLDTVNIALNNALGSSVSIMSTLKFDPSIIINFIVNIMLLMGGGIILLTAAYLVFNTFAMTLAERRADIGRLIAIGMTPQQASRGVFTEAVIIGITGSLAGLLLGAVLTIPVQLLVNAATGNRFEFVPLSPLAATVSVVMGLLVTLAATYPIARQAGNVSPLEMIFSQRKGPAKVSNVLNWLGLSLLVLGAIVELYISFGISGAAQMTLALLGSSTGHMIILFGLLLLVPGLLALWFKVLRQRIGNRLGLTAALALSNLEKQPVRAALTASALTIVVAATIMISGQTATLAASTQPMVRNTFDADFLLTPGGGKSTSAMMAFTSGKLFIPTDPKFYAMLDGLAPKMLVTRMSFVNVPEVSAMPGFPNGLAMDINMTMLMRHGGLVGATKEQVFKTYAEGPAVIISEPVADRMKLKVGDSFPIKTPGGIVNFKVAAIDNTLFYSYFDEQQAKQIFGGFTPLGMILRRKDGVALTEVEPQLREIAKQFDMQLIPLGDFATSFGDFYTTLGSAFSALGLLTMIVAALGILGTMYTSIMERQRELGILSAVGGTPAQLRNIVLVESLVLGISGAAIGAIIGVVIVILAGTVTNATAQKIQMVALGGDIIIPWETVIISLLVAPVVAIIATIIPARQVQKLDTVQALRYQG